MKRVNRSDDMHRKRFGAKQANRKASGDKRLADTSRVCAVDGCGGKPDGYSRYCSPHKYRLRKLGHPTVDLRIQTQTQYWSVMKIGRWLRRELTKTESDRQAWLRVEDAIERVKLDRRTHLDTITMARRDQHFANAFKAKVVIAAKLDKVNGEHILAGYLGMAAVIFAKNDVPVNATQLLHMTHKAAGRTVVRYARTVIRDAETGKIYKWQPSFGVLTRIGEFVEGEIAKEFGDSWWRNAQAVAAVELNDENKKSSKGSD